MGGDEVPEQSVDEGEPGDPHQQGRSVDGGDREDGAAPEAEVSSDEERAPDPPVRKPAGRRTGLDRSVLDQSADDTDRGWGERPDEGHDDWLREQRPPHWE